MGVAIFLALAVQSTFALDVNTTIGVYNGCREINYQGVSATLCYKGTANEAVTLDTSKISPLPDLLYGCKDVVYQGVSTTICYNGNYPRQSLRIQLQNSNWNIHSMNGVVITSSGTLSFGTNTVQAKLCNTMIGSYFAISKTLITHNMASTRMYCNSDIMSVENAFSHVTRSISTIDGDYLTISTPTRNVLVWKRQ